MSERPARAEAATNIIANAPISPNKAECQENALKVGLKKKI